ncbi:MAG TPA: hypothetical protein PK071_01840 [Atopobiaceae bacterium]|nr:hypothetical protein [Atopobiaceae bacterium]
MASMNQRAMEVMLGEILAEGEGYSCMLWSIFAANSASRIILAELSDLPDSKPNMMPLVNTYAYVGLTAKHLNLVVVNSYKPSQIMDRFSIPLSSITRVEAKDGLIIGKVLIVEMGDARIRFELSPFAAENRDEQQKAARSKLINRLVALNARR